MSLSLLLVRTSQSYKAMVSQPPRFLTKSLHVSSCHTGMPGSLSQSKFFLPPNLPYLISKSPRFPLSSFLIFLKYPCLYGSQFPSLLVLFHQVPLFHSPLVLGFSILVSQSSSFQSFVLHLRKMVKIYYKPSLHKQCEGLCGITIRYNKWHLLLLVFVIYI